MGEIRPAGGCWLAYLVGLMPWADYQRGHPGFSPGV